MNCTKLPAYFSEWVNRSVESHGLTFERVKGYYRGYFYRLKEDGEKDYDAYKNLEEAKVMFCKLYRNQSKCCVSGFTPIAITQDHPTGKFTIRCGYKRNFSGELIRNTSKGLSSIPPQKYKYQEVSWRLI